MRSRRTGLLVLLAGLASAPACSPSTPQPITDRAGLLQLVDSALALMRTHSLRRDSVDWPALTSTTRQTAQAIPALTADSAYRVIRDALKQLQDHHSVLVDPGLAGRLRGQTPLPVTPPTVALHRPGIGLVRLPKYPGFETGALRRYAQDLQDQIAALRAAGACAWIVDLRGNTGGNMWPMLAGIGPLLGEGTAGGFVSPEQQVPWGYRRGQAWSGASAQIRVGRPVSFSLLPPVAVLTDSQTASSGEAIAVAFRGRPHTRSFGQATRGLSTSNRNFPLPGGSLLVLTTAVQADRTGRTYGGPIPPDELTAPEETETRAHEWLVAQSCPSPAN